MRTNARWMLAALSMLVALALPAAAADNRELPASTVETPGGAQVRLPDLGDGRWLLVYVQPGSPSSTRLLEALRGWELQSYDHLAFVVGGERSAAVAFANADHQLPGARWAVDAGREAWKDLQLSGAPSLFGIEQGTIAWRLAGVLNDPATFRSVVISWLQP